jgi:hypothetical protein
VNTSDKCTVNRVMLSSKLSGSVPINEDPHVFLKQYQMFGSFLILFISLSYLPCCAQGLEPAFGAPRSVVRRQLGPTETTINSLPSLTGKSDSGETSVKGKMHNFFFYLSSTNINW